jgi:hypothetical protein
MQTVVSFFDESERIATEIYGVGGLFGSNHATSILELRWRDLLDRYQIEYYKSSELSAGEGQFKKFRDDPGAKERRRFSDREREFFRKVKTDFTDALVQSRGLTAIGAVVLVADYERFIASGEPGASLLSRPHYIATSLCLYEAGRQIAMENERLPEEDKGVVYPIFDSHEVYGWHIQNDFPEFCKKNPNESRYLANPVFESEREWIGLQPADAIVFEFAKYLENKIEHPHVPPRAPLQRMADANMLSHCYLVDYHVLQVLAREQIPSPTVARGDELFSSPEFPEPA